MAERRPQALRIGDRTAPLPIIQGGMGVGVSLSGPASAVANEGGIGVIATAGIGMIEADLFKNFAAANLRALRKEIRRARELSKGILGVNIMVALTNFGELVKTALDEGIDIIFSGAGLPLDLPHFRRGGDPTKLVPIVSSGRAARIIAKRWIERYDYPPDAVVVAGPRAGGHLGFKPEQLADPTHALALINAQRGRMRHGFAFAGENAHRATEILSVKDLVATLLDEYHAAQGQDLQPVEAGLLVCLSA